MRLFLILSLALISITLDAQILEDKTPVYNADSVRAIMDNYPYFTIFKDNYFVCGTPLGKTPSKTNSDVKFQLSISQRLTKSRLPFDTYLFIQYTQKNFWNLFENSMPMRDMNFNPGIGLGHLIIYKNRYIGRSYLIVEHESNGKDGEDSRSWNRITSATALTLNEQFEVQGKIWYPIVDGRNNKDLLRYTGIFQLAGSYRSTNEQFQIGLIVTKRKTWKMNFNTQIEFSYKFRKDENQFIFLQYYNGYGESLLEYNKFQSMIRLGFVIKPTKFSFY